MTDLYETFIKAASGAFPVADGTTDLIPRTQGATGAVIAFTNHAFIAADVEDSWLDANLDHDDVSSSMSPEFLIALANKVGRKPDTLDVVLAASPQKATSSIRLETCPQDYVHARLQRAHNFRSEVAAYTTADGGLLILGRGIAGRLEVAVEVAPNERRRGLGVLLAIAATQLADEPVFAQVAPGNTASLRMVLKAGFVPIGAEVLFF